MKRFLFILAIIFAFLCLSKCQLQEETKIPLSIPYELHHVVPEIITAYHREGNREEIEVFEYHSKELKNRNSYYRLLEKILKKPYLTISSCYHWNSKNLLFRTIKRFFY